MRLSTNGAAACGCRHLAEPTASLTSRTVNSTRHNGNHSFHSQSPARRVRHGQRPSLQPSPAGRVAHITSPVALPGANATWSSSFSPNPPDSDTLQCSRFLLERPVPRPPLAPSGHLPSPPLRPPSPPPRSLRPIATLPAIPISARDPRWTGRRNCRTRCWEQRLDAPRPASRAARRRPGRTAPAPGPRPRPAPARGEPGRSGTATTPVLRNRWVRSSGPTPIPEHRGHPVDGPSGRAPPTTRADRGASSTRSRRWSPPVRDHEDEDRGGHQVVFAQDRAASDPASPSVAKMAADHGQRPEPEAPAPGWM